MDYDSKADTLEHIARVNVFLGKVATALIERGAEHDQSKLGPEEKPLFDEMTPRLKTLEYGSDAYKESLSSLAPALAHHYAENSHHPEHYPDGIAGMTLLDLVEMYCDWKAAIERTWKGNFFKSLTVNKTRFAMSDQLAQIFENSWMAGE